MANGPGTPIRRLSWLLDELAKRFPDAGQPLSDQAPEHRYLLAIDYLIAIQRVMNHQSAAAGEAYADEVIRHHLQPAGSSMVAEVLMKCYEADRYHPERDPNSVLNHVMSEIGEVAIEVNIANGQSYKTPGPDGVIGEAIDAISALIDLIYRVKPDITEDEMADIARIKCTKWIENISQHQKNK